MTAVAAPARSLRRLLPLYLVVFNGFVGYSLMITVFTPLLLDRGSGLLAASSSGATRAVVLGVLLSLYPLGQFIGAPILGAISDRRGRRPVLIWTVAVSAAIYGVIAVALATENLALLMVACFVGGLFEANVAVTQSALADVADDTNRARLFGYVYLATSLAYVAGPLAGGPLADRALISWARPWTPFVVVCGLLVVTLATVVGLLPETRAPGSSAEGSPGLVANVTGIAAVVRDERLRRLYLGNFAFYLAIFGFFRVYPLYLVDAFKVSLTRESQFVAWVAVPIVVANLGAVSLLLRRFTVPALVAAGGVLAGVGLIVVPLPGVLNLLWVTLGLTSLGIAVLLPLCAARLSAAAGPDEQGAVLGNNQALQVGAEAISGLVGGGLAAVTTRLPLIVFGAVALGATVFSRGSARSRRT